MWGLIDPAGASLHRLSNYCLDIIGQYEPHHASSRPLEILPISKHVSATLLVSIYPISHDAMPVHFE